MSICPPSSSRSRNPAGRPKDAGKGSAILCAAQTLFLKHGFEQTTMDAVAKLAGVSKLTVYSHFDGKDTLFKAVIQCKCREYDLPAQYESLNAKPVEEALTEIGLNMMELICSPEAIAMHRVVTSEAVRHPKIAELFYEAGPEYCKMAFETLLSQWVEQKKLTVPDIPRARDHFYAMLKGEMHFRLLLGIGKPPGKPEREAHVASAVRMFLCAYR